MKFKWFLFLKLRRKQEIVKLDKIAFPIISNHKRVYILLDSQAINHNPPYYDFPLGLIAQFCCIRNKIN